MSLASHIAEVLTDARVHVLSEPQGTPARQSAEPVLTAGEGDDVTFEVTSHVWKGRITRIEVRLGDEVLLAMDVPPAMPDKGTLTVRWTPREGLTAECEGYKVRPGVSV